MALSAQMGYIMP